MPSPRTSPTDNQTSSGLVAWASKRAWSRVGAVAQVVPHARRYLPAYGARVTLHLLGCVTIATAVAMMLWNDIGVGPLDVFIGAVRNITGLPLAFSFYLVIAMLALTAWRLGRRPSLGALATTLLMGPLLQAFVAGFDKFTAPNAIAMQIGIHLGGIAAIGVGAGATIVANIGTGAPELLTAATSDRTGMSQPKIRLGFELSWLLVGALLGGPVGLGTVLVALAIGPAIAAGYRFVNSTVSPLIEPAGSTKPAVSNQRPHPLSESGCQHAGDLCRCQQQHPVWHTQTV